MSDSQRGRLQALVDAVKQMLQAGSPLLVLSLGALPVLDGTMSLGTMLAVNALAVGFLQPLATLVESGLQFQQLGSYMERIDDVLSCEPEQNRSEVTLAPRLSGRIELCDVSFRYGAQGPWVLKDVSLRVESGSSIAIVGKSGSGKSTLAALLLGLYPPSEGTIRYDDHDLADLYWRSVRRQIGIVPQRPYVFSGSVRENIALTDSEAPYERIVAAARTACLHDDIAALPMGYENRIADGGRIADVGSHEELLQRCRLYNGLIAAQTQLAPERAA